MIRHDSETVDSLLSDSSALDAFDDELLEASQDSYLLVFAPTVLVRPL